MENVTNYWTAFFGAFGGLSVSAVMTLLVA